MEEIRKVKERYKDYLLKLPNVVGVGVSNQHIVVMVEKLTPEIREMLPKTLDGIPVEIIEVGRIRLFDYDTTKRWRPAPGGVSIGHPEVTAGTLGCAVYKNGEIFGLSNNHVIAVNWGYRKIGRKGDKILQPGRYDGGKLPDDAIGELEDWVTVNISEPNKVDCAIFKPYDGMLRAEVLKIGIPAGIKEPEIGMKVFKFGRSCHYAANKIIAVNATVRVWGYGVCTFEEQFVVKNPFGIPGDSGSVVFTEGNDVVGLLFAGSYSATVCNYASNVARALNIDFVIPEVPKYYMAVPLSYITSFMIGAIGGAKPVHKA